MLKQNTYHMEEQKMTEQKNHTVFEHAFEDAPELMVEKY